MHMYNSYNFTAMYKLIILNDYREISERKILSPEKKIFYITKIYDYLINRLFLNYIFYEQFKFILIKIVSSPKKLLMSHILRYLYLL